MTPKFAAAVDTVFAHALDLFDRLEGGDATIDLKVERDGLRKQLDLAEVDLANSNDWFFAKYALVAWIDEMLRELLWHQRNEAIENSLEFELFNTSDAFYMFYTKATEASQLPKKDALEVFYLCVVLGFRGLYREQNAADAAQAYDLPPDVATWARRTARLIHTGQGRPPIGEKIQAPEGAPPLTGRYLFMGSVILGVILLVALLLSFYVVSLG